MAITNITISQLGPQGDGAGSLGRGRVFVDRAMPGERVKAFVHKDEKGILRGDLMEVVSASPYRQKAPCPHYDQCGNCTLQHLETNFYRHWKNDVVKSTLVRHGLRPRRVLAPLFFGGGNRRRITLTAFRKGSQVTLGYYQRRSSSVADIETCLIADPKLWQARAQLKPLIARLLPEETSVDVFLQVVGEQIDLVWKAPLDLRGRQLLAEVAEKCGIARASFQSGKKLIPARSGEVRTRFGALELALPAGAFLQPTPQGERALIRAVVEALPTTGKNQFADLFSGCGTFTGPLLAKGKVDAFEADPAAIHALQQATGPLPLRAFVRDLFRQPLKREELNRYDAVVFDPPRSGCPEQAWHLSRCKSRTLIAVSCNPSTFARDARVIVDGGFHFQSLQVVDQFHWSHHVEVVGVFTK